MDEQPWKFEKSKITAPNCTYPAATLLPAGEIATSSHSLGRGETTLVPWSSLANNSNQWKMGGNHD
jgi:hypothetical protein